LDKLEHLLRHPPHSAPALCQIGGELARLGRAQAARRGYRAAVESLRQAARAGDVELALQCEESIYLAFVRTVENEEHYYRCFRDWKDDLASLGRRFRDFAPTSAADIERIGFFLHSGRLLGHTEVLLKMLEARPRAKARDAEPVVYVLRDYDPAFMERCRASGVEAVSVADAIGSSVPLDARFLWLQERFRRDRIATCVWVSVPTMVSFAFAMRLAPVQIFWALRFHPLSGPSIDGYISWGAPDERTRRYGTQDWEVVPMPLAIDNALADKTAVDNLRRQFPESVLLGTLAREEKINSAPYLKAVADILSAHPQAGFLWTGRSEHPAIAGYLRAAGVAERCHFVGWVDTNLYAAALDVFLETFPFGSGVTSFQAFAAGVPLVSYLHPETIFGTYFWERSRRTGIDGAIQQPHLNAPDQYPILCARDPAEYVALAGRLISDAAWRNKIGNRGHAFYREELANNPVYAERFFATVSRIAALKLSQAAP
jgi:glycosyltransferase involved in cell wall biosynthesis